jgi:hypothetical protein
MPVSKNRLSIPPSVILVSNLQQIGGLSRGFFSAYARYLGDTRRIYAAPPLCNLAQSINLSQSGC